MSEKTCDLFLDMVTLIGFFSEKTEMHSNLI